MMLNIGNKVEINITQIVSAQEDKGGEEWKLFMTDDKTFVVHKSVYHSIRDMLKPPGSIAIPPLTLTMMAQGNIVPT